MTTDTDLQLDEYGDLVIGPGGEPDTCDELDCLIQDLRHRLMTVKGSLPADATYGGDLPLWLHAEMTVPAKRDLVATVAEEIAKDSRVLAQRTSVVVKVAGAEEIALQIGIVRKSDLAETSFEVVVS